MMRSFFIFGLFGPAATYLCACILTGWSSRWGDLPLAYGIELLPFLLCAYIDCCLEQARFWERAIAAGVLAFFASAITLMIAASWLFPGVGLGVSILAVTAIVPAGLCSLLSMPASQVPDLPVRD
jgi:hypothetical protein